MKLVAPGRKDPIGWFLDCQLETRRSTFGKETVEWQRIAIPRFIFSHVSQLLLLQGSTIGELIVPDAVLCHRNGLSLEGPFVFLAGQPPPAASASPSVLELRNLVLAKTPPLPANEVGGDFMQLLAVLKKDSE